MRQWIRLAYMEKEDWAAFTSIGPEYFIPNLDTTYAAVGIFENLGQTIPDPESTVKWINSLKTKEGGYSNPSTPQHFAPPPVFFQTYWAVSTLKRLRASFDQESLVKFLKHQQDEKGLFVFTDLTTSPTDYITPIYFVVQILDLAGISQDQWSKLFDFEVIQNYLLSYIEDQLSLTPPTLMGDKASLLILALQALAQIDPSLVPEEGKTWLKEKISEAPNLPGDLTYVILINNLLDACAHLSIDISDEKESLCVYLKEKIFPQQAPCGGFGYPSFYTLLEPMFTFEVVKLTKRLDLEYPRQDKLLSILKIHYLDGGYVPFVSANTSPDFTFFAYSLVKPLGLEKEFSSQKLLHYLETFLEEGEELQGSASSFQNIDIRLYQFYYALQVYGLLKGEISGNFRAKVIQTAQKLLNEAPTLNENSYLTLRNISSFSLIAKDLALDLDETSRSRIKESIDAILKAEREIRLLDFLCILESALYKEGEIPSREEIVKEVLELSTEEGAFKGSPLAPIPDLQSTYLSLKLLESLKASPEILGTQKKASPFSGVPIDLGKTKNFVLSCLSEFGFNYAPEDLIAQAPNTYLVPDLRITYQALKLLEYLASKGQ
ncbi:MAG: hypothetical protein QMD88_08580 [Coprothermobacterota bacterium]|nr:hypothetical protein [Coprothermobacterota bacterium]